MKRPTIGPITIPFAYTAQFLGRGCRVARSIAIEAELSVMLAHLDDSEAPISFRLTDCGRFDIPAGKSLDIRTALGRHWRPVGSYDGEPSSIDDFVAYLARGQHTVSGATHLREKAVSIESLARGRIVSDGRAAAEALIESKLGKLIVVDGHVWETTPEPVWVVQWPSRFDQGYSAYVEKENAIVRPADPKFVYPLDAIAERDAALDTFNASRNLPADFQLLRGQVEILRAEHIRYRHDEEPRLRHHLKLHLEYAGDQVRRSIDTISIKAFGAYRQFLAAVSPDSPMIDLVDALRTFNDVISGEPGWTDWHARTAKALDSWDRFASNRADDLAIEMHL